MYTLYGTYVLCLVLVWSYAHGRFGTPAEYRFTTRPGPYWWSYAGYVTCSFLLFLALCFVLALPPVKRALLDATLPKELGIDREVLAFAIGLPVPLAAALAVSVLLPRFPLLRKWDEELLNRFREWANIPGGVQDLAKRLEPPRLALTSKHVDDLRDFIVQEDRISDANKLVEHLRADRGVGFEESQFRFTRVMHLFHRVKHLSGLPRYSRFFGQRDKQFRDMEESIWSFAQRSKALLTLAREIRDYEKHAEFAEVLKERREVYKQECVAAFKPVAELLAYALLRAEATDEAVEGRLREIGFSSPVAAREEFPINDLTLLAVALLMLFLLVSGPFAPYLFPAKPDGTPAPGSAVMGAFIVVAHMLATLATVRLVQRGGAFRRLQGRRPPAFACLCWAALCAAASWLLCFAFGWLAGMGPNALFVWPLTVLNAVLVLALSYLCAGGLEEVAPAGWLQPLEAAVTATAMAFAGWIVAWQLGLVEAMSPGQRGRLYLVAVALPGLVGLLLGGFVPKIFRGTRTAAARKTPGTSATGTPGIA